ncbi:MAG: type VI secretion system-associated FHA domain protein [Nannocystales bacterium]
MTAVAIRVFDSEAGTTTEYAYTASPVRIGRNPLNDLTLPFPFVSGWHAVVRFDGSGAKFFDLGSTNGTLYNGRRVQAGEAIPVAGAVSLTIGKLELRIQQGEVAGATPAPPAPAPRVAAQAVVHNPAAYSPTSVHNSPAMPAPVNTTSVPNVPASPVPAPAPAQHRSPSPGAGAGTAAVDMGDVHQSVNRLRPHYDAYRQSWRAMLQEVSGTLSSMPPETHGYALSILQREFPEVVGEPEFKRMAEQAGALQGSSAQRSSGGSSGAVARLASSIRPGDAPPASAAEEERFLSCVEDVLRASAKALVELQKGQEQFGAEMGVRTIKEYTALHAAGSSEAVLAYLLDWKAGGTARTQELVGVYADLMIHQVALINGLMEGVRGLLSRLSPQEIERGVNAGWATRGAAVWKRYVEKHQQLTGEDQTLTSVVFGPEFARAYAEVGGEGTSSGS